MDVTAIVAILAVFSVPLSAIIGSFYLKLQKLKIENRTEDENLEKLRQQILYSMSAQDELRERVEQLEKKLRERGEEIPQYSSEAIRLDNEFKHNNKNLK